MSKSNTIDTDDEAREFTKLVCQAAAKQLEVSATLLRDRGMPTLAGRVKSAAEELRTMAREVELAERENG